MAGQGETLEAQVPPSRRGLWRLLALRGLQAAHEQAGRQEEQGSPPHYRENPPGSLAA